MCSKIGYRNHRKKLLHQQKERFRNKYREKGIGMLEKNKSLDNIEHLNSDSNKEDSLHLDPLVNPNKVNFNKTKVPEDSHIDNLIEKRKGLSTVHQKRKKLKPDVKVWILSPFPVDTQIQIL